MKSTIFLLFLALPLIISGQAVSGPADYEVANMDMLNPNRMLLRTKSADAYGTMGTPYVFKDFKKGNIFYTNKMRVDDKLINYDCYNDRLEYTAGESIYLLNASQIDYFEIFPGQDSTMLFKQVFIEKLNKRIFMEVLYNKNSILCKRYYKEFRAADYGGAYSQDRRYDEYHDRQSYYIKTADNELQMIKTNKKSLIGDHGG